VFFARDVIRRGLLGRFGIPVPEHHAGRGGTSLAYFWWKFVMSGNRYFASLWHVGLELVLLEPMSRS